MVGVLKVAGSSAEHLCKTKPTFHREERSV